MKTNFFTELEKLNLNEISISLIFKDEKVTVLVLPKTKAKDNATNLKPITLCATIEEMDNKFFDTVGKPLKDTGVYFSNVLNFEKDKAEKEQQTAEKKEQKNQATKKEDKLNTLVKSDDFNPNESKSKVLLLCKEILVLNPNSKLAKQWNTKINELTSKNLFN